MAGLKGLTSTQIQTIANALANVKGSDSLTGQALPPVGRLQPYLYALMDMNALPSNEARSHLS